MNRFFLRKGIFVIIAMSVLSIAFFGCFHDSDDDDDDTTASSSATADYALLKGAYLDGLQEVTIPVELNSTALSALSQGYDASSFFSAETSSSRFARSVGSSFASDFYATVSKVTASGITLSFSGKTSALDYLFSLIATIPAAYTASGSATTRTAITLSVGQTSSVPETSLDFSSVEIPSASELANQTFKYVRWNCATGYKVVFYKFASNGETATQTTYAFDTDEDGENGIVTFTNVPFETGVLKLCHGHKKTSYDYSECDADDMKLIKAGNKYYLYSTDDFQVDDTSNTLFKTYYTFDKHENKRGGTSISLSKNGTVSGSWEDEKDGTTSTGILSGTFVNNDGVITFNYKVTSDGDELFAMSESVIFNGTNILDGNSFEKYLGEVPSN